MESDASEEEMETQQGEKEGGVCHSPETESRADWFNQLISLLCFPVLFWFVEFA